MEEMKDLLTRGACFYCKKTGHRSRECPEKGNEKRNSDARVAAIMARMGYAKKETIKSATNEVGLATTIGKVLKIASDEEGN